MKTSKGIVAERVEVGTTASKGEREERESERTRGRRWIRKTAGEADEQRKTETEATLQKRCTSRKDHQRKQGEEERNSRQEGAVADAADRDIRIRRRPKKTLRTGSETREKKRSAVFTLCHGAHPRHFLKYSPSI